MRLILVRGSNFGQMPFLPPVGVERGFAGCKSTESRLLLQVKLRVGWICRAELLSCREFLNASARL